MLRDLVHALRSWRRQSGLYALNVIVLAIGVGMAAALSTLVGTVLLRPLPYDASEDLHVLWFRAPGLGIDQFDHSPGTYLHFLDSTAGPGGSVAFEELGLYSTREVALTGQHEPRRLLAATVTPSVLRALRVAPSSGQLFPEAAADPGSEATVLIAERLWREQYGAALGLLGGDIRIDGVDRRVIGILPSRFAFPSPEVQLWLPEVIDRGDLAVTNFSYRALARLPPGADREALQARLETATATLPVAYPDELSERFVRESGMQPFLQPLRDEVLGGVASMLWIALAAVAAVLAIAAANVANLFFVRADARATEHALRTALGAGRLVLLRRGAADGVVVGLPAGVLGACLAAIWLTRVHDLPGLDLPRIWELSVGPATLLGAAALGLVVGAALGVLARWRLRGDAHAAEALHGARGSTGSRASWRARRAFVIAQVAASTALLLAAGILLRSFSLLSEVEPGFEPRGMTTLFVSLPQADYPTAERSLAFWRQVDERLAAAPGVESASVVSKLPFDIGGQTGTLVDGHPSPDGLSYVFGHRLAGADYFRTAGIPLLAGRAFEPSDAADPHVAVVSEALARRFWSSPEAALGRKVRGAGRQADGSDLPWARIVGVVGDLRDAGLREPANPTVYSPLSGEVGAMLRSLFLVVRSAPGHTLDLETARQAVAAVDPNVPLARYRRGVDLVAGETARLRFTAMLLTVAAATATAIGAFGLFAILLSFVGARRREIGLRLAVGATRADVRWLVASTALRLVGVGAVIGLLVSLATGRALSSFLYGVGALDPLTLAAVTALLASVALVAAMLPASRAAAVDPADELRAE